MTSRIKDPTVCATLALVGGSILLSTVLTILNAVVYLDPALLFAVMLIVIPAAWSVLNRWEGEQQLRRIQSESRKLEPDAVEQKRQILDSSAAE